MMRRIRHAVVHVVADAIFIDVRVACTAAHAEGVKLVSLAIAISGWNVVAPAIVHLARSVAHAAFVDAPTQSSTSSQTPSSSTSASQAPPHTPRASSWFPSQSQSPAGMSSHPHSSTSPGPLQMPHASNAPTQSSTLSQTPSSSASSVQVPPHTPRASSWFPSQSQSPFGMSVHPHSYMSPGPLQMPQASNAPTQLSTSSQTPSSSTSAMQVPPHTPKASSWFPLQSQSPAGMSVAPAFVDVARSVADATCVEFAHAVVHVVADAISIVVCGACTAAHAEGVELVSIAVAVSSRNVFAPAFVDLARPVADAAGVERSDAVVHVVAHAVSVHVGCASAAADAEGVELVSVAVAVSVRNVRASAFVDVARTVADAAGVEFAHAVVDVVADAISIRRRLCKSRRRHAEGVKLVPLQSQSPSGMSSHPHS